jgi:hypothetical protein
MIADELHVLPHPRNGGWLVDGRWFATVHEAQEAALKRGAARIWLHDRYHRVRAVKPRREAG